jgi:hypothetical protein
MAALPIKGPLFSFLSYRARQLAGFFHSLRPRTQGPFRWLRGWSRRPRGYHRRHLLNAVQPAHSRPVIAAERASVRAVGYSGSIIVEYLLRFDARCGK